MPHFSHIGRAYQSLSMPTQSGRERGDDMKLLTQSYRGVSFFVQVNVDRLLVPLTIVGALTLAGWLLSYATVH